MYTTEQVIKAAEAAKARHDGRISESEKAYRDDIRYLRGRCQHEVTDIKYVCDFNNCCYHVTYCVACGKEID